MATELHQYDVGASIIVAIQENGTALNVSSASAIAFYYLKPDETTTGSWTGIARSGSTDQFIYVTTASTDLSASGQWQLQAYFALDPWEGSAEKKPFLVNDSLRG